MEEKEKIGYKELVSQGAPMRVLNDYNVEILRDYVRAANDNIFDEGVVEAVDKLSKGNVKKWGANVFINNHRNFPQEVHAYVKGNWNGELSKYQPTFFKEAKGKSFSDLGDLVSDFVDKFGDLSGSLSVENKGGMINRNYHLFENTYVTKIPVHQSEGDDLEIMKENLESISRPHSVKYLDKENFVIEDSNLK
jgi:hypothetical protein